jgi:hypothetical protein
MCIVYKDGTTPYVAIAFTGTAAETWRLKQQAAGRTDDPSYTKEVIDSYFSDRDALRNLRSSRHTMTDEENIGRLRRRIRKADAQSRPRRKSSR